MERELITERRLPLLIMDLLRILDILLILDLLLMMVTSVFLFN